MEWRNIHIIHQHNIAIGCCRNCDECQDKDVCTLNRCDQVTHRCNMTAIAGCCTMDSQCSDQNNCTRDRCVNNLCLNDVIDCDDGKQRCAAFHIILLKFLFLFCDATA